jgi:amino acid transporter
MEDIKSSGVDYNSDEKNVPAYDVSSETGDILIENVDDLKRRLSGRQIQMITIGGSIGTALFVSIGSGLVSSGPGSLFIAFIMYCVFLAAVNNCMAEMAVFMPVSGSFIRMGSKWVDEAFGFMLGWNFFLYGELSMELAERNGLTNTQRLFSFRGKSAR